MRPHAAPMRNPETITFPRPPVRLWGSVGPALPIPPWRFLDQAEEEDPESVLSVLDRLDQRLNAAQRRLDANRDRQGHRY